MEADIIKYVINQFPQIAIVALLLFWQTKRMEKIEDTLCKMLDDCWRRYDDHMNGEKQ